MIGRALLGDFPYPGHKPRVTRASRRLHCRRGESEIGFGMLHGHRARKRNRARADPGAARESQVNVYSTTHGLYDVSHAAPREPVRPLGRDWRAAPHGDCAATANTGAVQVSRITTRVT